VNGVPSSPSGPVGLRPLADQVRSVAAELAASLAGHPLAPAAKAIVARLDGPLRVAIAGRVKAGKSTLLNALVGERLAPTDAGECTKLVTWYQEGSGYDVNAMLHDGRNLPVRYQRAEGSLDIDLGGIDIEAIDRLDIRWPSSALRGVTLIDTPGLASINSEHSARTEHLLTPHSGPAPAEADAVIYLMRHVHQRDVSFLDAFMDRTVSLGTPLNAVGLISRADEIGVGRPDAIESARRIAERYRTDPQLRPLVANVLPVAGLLAETAATLREDEVGALRQLAAMTATQRDDLTVTADRFRDVDRSPVTAEIRTALLNRLGMFGVRFSLSLIAGSPSMPATEVARALTSASGIGDVRRLIAERFLPQARVLQARSALVTLRSLVPQLAAFDQRRAADLLGSVEHVESAALDFTRLRVMHLLASGLVTVDAEEAGELSALAVALGDRSRAAIHRPLVLQRIEQYRTRLEDPLIDGPKAELWSHAVRLYESAFIETSATPVR
jgi:Dynamin family